MSAQTRRGIAAFVSGAIFSIGLAVGGMTEPANVIGFLDVTGEWRPALMFVMVGAIAVNATVYQWVRRRPGPLFGERFALPTRRDLDARLLGGAAIFGVGWGLGGYCPGPGVTALVSGSLEAVVFVASMLAGLWVVGAVQRAKETSSGRRAAARSES